MSAFPAVRTLNPTGIDPNQALGTLAGNARANMDRAAKERQAAADRQAAASQADIDRAQQQNQFMAKLQADKEYNRAQLAEKQKDREHISAENERARGAERANQEARLQTEQQMQQARLQAEHQAQLDENARQDKQFNDAMTMIQGQRTKLAQEMAPEVFDTSGYTGPIQPGVVPAGSPKRIDTLKAESEAMDRKLAADQSKLEVYQGLHTSLKEAGAQVTSEVVKTYAEQLEAEQAMLEGMRGKTITSIMGLSAQMATGIESGGPAFSESVLDPTGTWYEGINNAISAVIPSLDLRDKRPKDYAAANQMQSVGGPIGTNPLTGQPITSAPGELPDKMVEARRQDYMRWSLEDPTRTARYVVENVVANVKGGPPMDPQHVSAVTDILMSALDPKQASDGTFQSKLQAYLDPQDPEKLGITEIGTLLDTFEKFGDVTSSEYAAIRGGQELAEVSQTGKKRGEASVGSLDKRLEEGLKLLTGAKTNVMKGLTGDLTNQDAQGLWTRMTHGGMDPAHFQEAVTEFMEGAFTDGSPQDRQSVLEFVNEQAGLSGEQANRLVQKILLSDGIFQEILRDPRYLDQLSPQTMAILEADTGDVFSMGQLGKQVGQEMVELEKTTAEERRAQGEMAGKLDKQAGIDEEYRQRSYDLDQLAIEAALNRR